MLYHTSPLYTTLLSNFPHYHFPQSITYLSLREILVTIVEGNLQWMWAIDALEAYYRVPIKDKYLRFHGIKLAGMTFFFCCLVMGMAAACKVYTEFADVVAWIVTDNNKHLFTQFLNGWDESDGIRNLLLHYIDDFSSGHPTKIGAEAQFKAILWWWRLLGIPTQDRKCIHPTQRLPYRMTYIPFTSKS